MVREREKLFSFSLVSILISVMVLPIYGEVQSFQIDKKFYTKGDEITFSGFVEDKDSGLVTIVIRDSNDKFVLLTQALINPDNSFQRSIDINEKFLINGIYNATAFIINMTAGEVVQFDYSANGSPISPSVLDVEKNLESQEQTQQEIAPPKEEKVIADKSEPTAKIASFVNPDKDPQYYLDRYYNEPNYKAWFDRNYPDLTIEEAVGAPPPSYTSTSTKIPGFPDPDEDSQYYLDRYENEKTYKEWFDRNFPDQTIYEVLGISEPVEEEEPSINSTVSEPTPLEDDKVISSSEINDSSTSKELSQLILALGGIGILFGAVYGIKRKVDHNSQQLTSNHTKMEQKVAKNSDQISQNRFWIKKKLFKLKKCDEPINVIKDRLAKGEITVDEYYKLLRALKKH